MPSSPGCSEGLGGPAHQLCSVTTRGEGLDALRIPLPLPHSPFSMATVLVCNKRGSARQRHGATKCRNLRTSGKNWSSFFLFRVQRWRPDGLDVSPSWGEGVPGPNFRPKDSRLSALVLLLRGRSSCQQSRGPCPWQEWASPQGNVVGRRGSLLHPLPHSFTQQTTYGSLCPARFHAPSDEDSWGVYRRLT